MSPQKDFVSDVCFGKPLSQDDCKVEFGAQRWEFYVLGFGGDSLPIANQFKNT